MDIPHIEKEYKMMITKETYDLIKGDLSNTVIQTNYYYSSNVKGIAMRIRQINNQFVFTLKHKIPDAHEEYEFPIADNSLNHSKIKEVLDKFNVINPQYIGSMTTTRSTSKLKFGEFTLDKSDYLGITDYEIEYELFDSNIDGLAEFQLFLSKYGLKYETQSKGKYHRFMEAKK